MPRLFCPLPLASGQQLDLPAGAARHVQVLRLQPGDAVTLFNGQGGEFAAVVERMGRSDVAVTIGDHDPVEREASRAVHLVVGMPANERMDWLVEKAAELGAASIQPVLAQRSVLRLQGERAQKKQAHWQAIAIAACEQSGRNRVPAVHEVMGFAQWAAGPGLPGAADQAQGPPERLLLSLGRDARSLSRVVGATGPVTLLSGPEGGLTAQEEGIARALGFAATHLGARVLRAETAPLAVLAALTLAA
jgi:16S rRNA (uracil1498-N3)-methyltransferase